MSWKNLPFSIVIIATMLPWFVAMLNMKWMEYLPISLALLFYLIYEIITSSKILNMSYGFFIMFTIITITSIWQLINNLGIGSGGIIIVITLTYIFLRFFESKESSFSPYDLIRQIHFIYSFHIIFILFEFLIRIAGFTDLIISLVGSGTDVKIYKM